MKSALIFTEIKIPSQFPVLGIFRENILRRGPTFSKNEFGRRESGGQSETISNKIEINSRLSEYVVQRVADVESVASNETEINYTSVVFNL